VVQIVLWYLDSGCSKHMTRNRSQLTNFINKFLGTVKFGNDHIAKIMGYGDYQIGNVTISKLYYVEGLGHNLFSDSNLEVAFLPEVVAPVFAVSIGSPSLTYVDQDAPSPSTSQTLQASTSHVIAPGAVEENHDIEVAHMDNNP
nr:integrase, catalytic region, zinc finger, CCHC-type, peptidase aspartic, catalytic [Tanacetum cinerariifolium]